MPDLTPEVIAELRRLEAITPPGPLVHHHNITTSAYIETLRAHAPALLAAAERVREAEDSRAVLRREVEAEWERHRKTRMRAEKAEAECERLREALDQCRSIAQPAASDYPGAASVELIVARALEGRAEG